MPGSGVARPLPAARRRRLASCGAEACRAMGVKPPGAGRLQVAAGDGRDGEGGGGEGPGGRLGRRCRIGPPQQLTVEPPMRDGAATQRQRQIPGRAAQGST
jgi:hypothetical protein